MSQSESLLIQIDPDKFETYVSQLETIRNKVKTDYEACPSAVTLYSEAKGKFAYKTQFTHIDLISTLSRWNKIMSTVISFLRNCKQGLAEADAEIQDSIQGIS